MLRQAVALDGLHFNLLPPDQCARLALAVERAADEARAEFRNRVTARDRDFADRLDALRLSLSDLTRSYRNAPRTA
jgi:hypothetical protein